jgi:hypothetical protein
MAVAGMMEHRMFGRTG